MKILFIGNSFTGRNDLPGLVTEMAAAVSQPKVVESLTHLVNGASLRLHWNAGVAMQKLSAENWDYVVLQEQSTLPIKNAARFRENVLLFHERIQASGASTVLYLTWARKQAPETQAALNESTLAIAKETGALLVPVGLVWSQVQNAEPGIELYDKDGSHPSAAGSYLAACVFYRTLFGESILGLAVPQRLKLNDDHAAKLQEFAERASFISG